MKNSPFLLLVPLIFLTVPAWSADKGDAPALPLKEVALFSSGVGYFGRAGQIDGDARVELHVKAPQISDLLKSLVLFDPKGTIKPVSYSLADWIGAQRLDTDLKLSNIASPGSLLSHFQGASIRVEKPSGAVEGRIMSVSELPTAVANEAAPVEYLTLLTEAGVQTVRLNEITSFKLLDPVLNSKLTATLEKSAAALSKQLDDGIRAVNLNFGGKGVREVRAGYLLETPAWKTSYRLVLDATKKPYLQGWAIVENTTDEDWNDVHLSLISGRPISFIQDLATPVYVSRPIVAPMIIGSPLPQTFGQGFAPQAPTQVDGASRSSSGVVNQNAGGFGGGVGGGGFGNAGRGGFGNNRGGQNSLNEDDQRRTLSESEMQLEGAQAQAQGGERGELFEYAIDGTTTLDKGEAAMVPIVSTDIGGEPLTVVESGTQKGDLTASNGYYLRNTTGLHLQGGPITVFSAGIYAGDAMVTNLSPNDSRLITYAVDLELGALQTDPQSASTISKISFSDGVLRITQNMEMTRTWTFKNKSNADKKVLLQVPDDAAWTLADPKQLEGKALGVQRFRITAKPGETSYSVKWLQTSQNIVEVLEGSTDSVEYYSNDKVASPAMKAKLAEFVALKRKMTDLVNQRTAQEATLKDIEDDQTRIRANMEPLDKSGQLFKSYETKLGAQEDKIEKIRGEITRLRDAEATARDSLKNALNGLNLE